MASILRQIVAGPRARHPEAGLDLCYVTDNIIATSGPSSVWPKKAYRNPTDQLVKFLDYKHGDQWSIFEFRAEGTGYPDSEVYNRIHHFPWPDHHPPPFGLIPAMMASMRNWLQGGDGAENHKRVAVVHCKAGKGRSGTSACSYLISEEGWTKEEALKRFTERRMRVGFGAGVSIPSQLRWVGYVERWTNSLGKKYVERPVEIVEIHVWGLRDGVKVVVEGYVDEGRRIEGFHIFNRQERIIVDDGKSSSPPQPVDYASTSQSAESSESSNSAETPTVTTPTVATPTSSTTDLANSYPSTSYPSGATVLLKPSSPIILPTSDINIDFERRNKAAYTGWTMVTSVAHVWFNAYFEGGHQADSGVYEIEWDAMDGIKGSARKGTKALNRLKVLWRYAKTEENGDAIGKVITEPAVGEPVPEGKPADWKGSDAGDKDKGRGARHSDGVSSGRAGGAALTMGATVAAGAESLGKELGLRKQDPDSADISRANSMKNGSSPAGHSGGVPREKSPARKSEELARGELEGEGEEREGLRVHGPEGEEYITYEDEGDDAHEVGEEGKRDTKVGKNMEAGMGRIAHIVSHMKGNGVHDGQGTKGKDH